MNVNTLKLSLLTYIKHLSLYDYLAFTWLILTFLVLIVLAILIAKRSSVLSLLLVIFSLLFLVVAPMFIKLKLADSYRKASTEVTLVKRLTFSDSLIVEGIITNESKKDFSLCLVQTSVFRDTNATGIKAIVQTLKPLVNRSILLEQELQKENSMDFRSVFENFVYTGDFNATLKAECY